MTRKTVSSLGEISLINQIRKRFSEQSKNVQVGIGDDAAVLSPPGKSLLVTTDMMVEGVHFDLCFMTAYQLGFKLISVNVSDIYAMGGVPHFVLLNIALRGNTPAAFVQMFMKGIGDALQHYRAFLVGGDLSAVQGGISLSATVIGSARKYVLRSGARVGDRIYVTGTLGDSICGLHVLKQLGRTVPITLHNGEVFHVSLRERSARGNVRSERKWLQWKYIEPLVRRHLLPEARNPATVRRVATAMIDVSDGLLLDLTRLCNESGVGARIFEEKIPISTHVKRTAKYLGFDPLALALSGGEDYELLFTARPHKEIAAACIGEVVESGRIIVGKKGKERAFSLEGYRHFSA